MTKGSSSAIFNSSLPARFRQIRLVLAREPGHPEGDPGIAYVIVAPLSDDDHIDAEMWKKHRQACRVARLRPDQPDSLGHLVHRPGGSWAFQYDIAGNNPDETGYHFADERFVQGEYVSINEDGAMHTFRVVSVSRL
ncbi:MULTISPECIES: hypothetical protein [Rhodopseudomonas]|uniref:Uncharacterized protein n=1 Tax=Rhodopseudomonas palustris TaxID=1076 RepID=A0A0D7EFS7_RHOPL|nr:MULTISPECIES: hypothetical protein [Rhodopseudomonas]KIZ39593.1 hypothetical protein OO17_20020 [Rhodopseudomonas palustris]MDF3813846.1 hypothetical protein [Rhodopseudomonas sp. BAL398]WOK15438.1 hypothetical protein RBJ75_14680 [Rhodopseudomonas sp. BAL398]